VAHILSRTLRQVNEAGVEITSPHYSALRDGNQIAIPEDDSPKNYSALAFRIGLFDNARRSV
jgi:hypothetical protein